MKSDEAKYLIFYDLNVTSIVTNKQISISLIQNRNILTKKLGIKRNKRI